MALWVRFAENFAANLEAIREFLLTRDAATAPRLFDSLLGDIDAATALVARQPNIGRLALFLSRQSPKVAASLRALGALRQRAGVHELREYVSRGYLVLYAVREEEVVFLSIRAHRQRGYAL